MAFSPSLTPAFLRALLERTRDQPGDVVREARALLPAARASGDRAALVGVLTALGSGLLKCGSQDEARTVFDEAMDIASGESELEARVTIERLNLFIILGDSTTLDDDHEQLVMRLNAIRNPRERTSAMNNLAGTAFRQGRHTDAVRWLQRARHNALDCGDCAGAALAASNSAMLHIHLEQYGAALVQLRQALSLSDSSQTSKIIQAQLAKVYGELGHHQRALEVTDQYLDGHPLTVLTNLDRVILINRAEALLNLDRVPEAAHVIEMHALQGAGGDLVDAEALDTLGQIYTRQGRVNEARTLLLESLRIYEQLPASQTMAGALLNLAALEIQEEPRSALDLTIRAVKQIAGQSSERFHVRALRLQAQAYAALGDYRLAFELSGQAQDLQNLLDRQGEQQRVEVALAELEHEHTQALARIQRDALRDARAEVADLHAHLETRVAQRTHELQTANEELRAFARSVSHYLRTPMQLILGHATMLGLLPPDQQARSTDVIVESTERMAEVLDGLLAYATREAVPLDLADVNLTDTVQSAWNDQMTSGRVVCLEVGPLPMVRGDPAALRVVFGNLLHNAVKFTGAQPCPQVQVTARPVPGGTEIEVRDNGVGFDPRDSTRLFGAFTRLPTVTRFEGLGLGLADVWRIVIAHGGHVRAEGRPGLGASFFVTLPHGGDTAARSADPAQAGA